MSKAWPLTKLADVLTPISRLEKVDPVKEYRLLGIRLDGIGPFLREIKTGSEIAANNLLRVHAGDFIYSRLFAWRGAFGVISADLDGCYVSGEFPAFITAKDKIDTEFLRLWFRLPTTIFSVGADCSGSTPLTRNRFKEQFFLNMQIPLPPLSEQQRIVAKIDELTEKIKGAWTVKQYVVDKLHQLLLSVFNNLISGVELRPMNEVAPITRRPVDVDINGKFSELGIRSFGKGSFHKSSLKGFEVGTKRLYHIEPGDLVFNNVFAWEGAVAVAKQKDIGRVGSHRFITCVPKHGVTTSNFLCFYFLTKEGIEKLGEASPGGAGRNRTLGLEALGKITVPVPPYKKQIWFDNLQRMTDSLKSVQAETQKNLDALMPSILDKAFKGEL